jgi:hypothetical protein
LISNPTDPLDVKKFNEYCGVGVVITLEQIKQAVINQCFFKTFLEYWNFSGTSKCSYTKLTVV